MKASEKEVKYQSIREALEQIQKEQLNPKELSLEDRRLCVEFLRYEGRQSIQKIARILKVSEAVIKADLKIVNVGMARALEHGEIAAELVGQIIGQMRTNYDMALEKRDVSGANRSTEMLKELAQDLGHVTKAGDTVHHKGINILSLALGAAEKDSPNK